MSIETAEQRRGREQAEGAQRVADRSARESHNAEINEGLRRAAGFGGEEAPAQDTGGQPVDAGGRGLDQGSRGNAKPPPERADPITAWRQARGLIDDVR